MCCPHCPQAPPPSHTGTSYALPVRTGSIGLPQLSHLQDEARPVSTTLLLLSSSWKVRGRSQPLRFCVLFRHMAFVCSTLKLHVNTPGNVLRRSQLDHSLSINCAGFLHGLGSLDLFGNLITDRSCCSLIILYVCKCQALLRNVRAD